MKITFDTVEEKNMSRLGRLLTAFINSNGVHPEHNDYDVTEGKWVEVTDTPRNLLVAVMGDSIYDRRPRWTHLRHIESGLDVLWYHDGDLTVLFHEPSDSGFTIINRNSSLVTWDAQSLEDPRNDPAYDPFVIN